MDCIDLFKKAAAALQTDPRYLELDAARRENDMDEELQNMIGEFNLARLDLNNESAKAETDAARVAELNQRVNDLYSQIMASEGMVRYNAAKAECEAMVSHIDAIINTAMNGGDPMTVQAPTGGRPYICRIRRGAFYMRPQHCTQPHAFRADMESAPTRTTYQLESTGV